jgi:hypothetical protein
MGVLKRRQALAVDWDSDDLPSTVATEVNKIRQSTYGDPTPNMEMLARLWSAFLGVPISAEDASQMMVLLKIMREKQSGYRVDYPDNAVDQCGWTNVLFQVKESHARQDQSQQDAAGA